MMHSSLASIIDETVSEPRQPAHTADSDDLAARFASALPALVTCYKQFEESHGSGEDGGDVGLERVSPELLGPVVEVVVSDLLGGGFGGGLGAGVGGGVEGRLAGVVDEEVDVACFLGDLVDGTLQVVVRGCAALDGDEVAVFLVQE